MSRRTRLAIAVAALCTLAAPRAQTPEIRVLMSGAFTAAFTELAPEFERTSGSRIVTKYGGSMGNSPDTIPNRLARGEPADVVILAASALDDLIANGRVVAGSRVDLARSAIGMAVRAGAAKPDISTIDALKRTLLQAKSIAYSSSASGVYLSGELFPSLGIADRIAAKSRRIESGPVGESVARGEAELGFQQISELRPVNGIEIVGPLPSGAQRITVFSAGIVASATQPDAARRLIAYLSSPTAAPAIRKSGMDPLAKANSIGSGPEHARLAALCGTWDVEVTFWTQPGRPGVTSKGTSTIRPLFDGLFVEEKIEGTLSGASFTTLAWTGFNTATHQYEATRIASTNTIRIAETGVFDSQSNQFELKADYPFAGDTWHQRTVIHPTSADAMIATSYLSFGNVPEWKGVEITYRRRAPR